MRPVENFGIKHYNLSTAVVLGGAVLAMPIVAVSRLTLVAISVTLHFIRVIDIFDKWS